MLFGMLASISLGALVGMFVGMSASPVIGSVLGVIVSAAFVYLNLDGSVKKKYKKLTVDERLRLESIQNLAIVGFCVSCLLSSMGSLWIRSNNILGLSPIESTYKALISINVTEKDARSAVLKSLKVGEIQTNHLSGVFFSSGVRDQCSRLAPRLFKDSNEVINAFNLAGEPWKGLSNFLEKLQTESQKIQFLRGYWHSICRKHV